MKAPLSVIVPTCNEGENIQECLESVSWAGEIIVIDGGSHDRTLEVASRYATIVLRTENAPAEIQRLKGLKKARHEWFFVLDADERVSEPLRKSIESAIASGDGVSAFEVLRLNLYQGKAVHLHHPDYQLRLFRKSEIGALPERIHRLPKPRGKTGRLDGGLLHHFFPSVEAYLAKLNRYTALEAAYRRRDGRIPKVPEYPYFFLIRPAGRFFQYYLIRRGWRDGFFGFFYSAMSAFYEVMLAVRTVFETPSEESW